jgi:hypothetical protein
LDLLDSGDIHSCLRRIRFIIGVGHETMCYTRTMLQVLRHMGYGVVGALHSFETESSQNFLFSGADNHKAMEFLMYVTRPTMTVEMLLCCLDTLPTVDECLNVNVF